MARRKPGGQMDPPAALPPEDPSTGRTVRVVFRRRHQHRGQWYDAGESIFVTAAELDLLQAFAEIELP